MAIIFFMQILAITSAVNGRPGLNRQNGCFRGKEALIVNAASIVTLLHCYWMPKGKRGRIYFLVFKLESSIGYDCKTENKSVPMFSAN